MYTCVTVCISALFSGTRGSFLVLSAPGHAGARPNKRRKCGPWSRYVALALGFQSREKWQVTTGRHSEHVEPSRSMQTHIQVKKMSGGFRMSLIILLTASTDCLPTSCSCSSVPCARARVLSCPCSCSSVRFSACWKEQVHVTVLLSLIHI